MNEIIRPVLGREVYIASTSYVGGDVVIGDHSTVMHHVMICRFAREARNNGVRAFRVAGMARRRLTPRGPRVER